MFGGNFPPSGWLFCNGQTLAIAEYDTLFNLIGTTYGGDGQNTFAIPNLQGRMPCIPAAAAGRRWRRGRSRGTGPSRWARRCCRRTHTR